MAKALGIIKETQAGPSKGAPDLSVPYSGFVYVGPLPGNYAVYVITGTGAQLTAIQADANCVAGALITEDGVKWPEMNQPVPAGIRTKINTYRANQGLAPIGAGVTLKQVAQAAAAHFDGAGNFDVYDGN
jgi:hypothetical protein